MIEALGEANAAAELDALVGYGGELATGCSTNYDVCHHGDRCLPRSRLTPPSTTPPTTSDGTTFASLLEKLGGSLSEVREVVGVRCIPLMQVVLLLTSDLDGEGERDKAVLMTLLNGKAGFVASYFS